MFDLHISLAEKGQKENKDVWKCGYAPICEKCYIELLHLFICFFFALDAFKGNIFHVYIFGEFFLLMHELCELH